MSNRTDRYTRREAAEWVQASGLPAEWVQASGLPAEWVRALGLPVEWVQAAGPQKCCYRAVLHRNGQKIALQAGENGENVKSGGKKEKKLALRWGFWYHNQA